MKPTAKNSTNSTTTGRSDVGIWHRLGLTCDKALSYLRWTPVLNFDETMKISADWYRSFYQDGAAGIRAITDGQLDYYTELAADRGLSWANS